MSFNVVLYTRFSKPKNSTKKPSSGDSFPCSMVEPCGVIAPRISFNKGVSWNPTAYNYAYIKDFGRYYWVAEWTFDSGRWYVTLSVDAMASWKEGILNSSEYVVRSASAVSPTVIDTFYPAINTFSYQNTIFRPWNNRTLESGCYVIGLVGGSQGDTTGGVTYYLADAGLLNSFMTSIMSTPNWMGVPGEISEELMKCLINPLQYVTSVKWFPIDANDWASSAVVPFVGWWKPDSALLTYSSSYTAEGSLGTRASHPQAGSSRTYLNYAPYTRLSVYFPPFGTISLNPDQFPPGVEISYEVVVDGISGMGYLRLNADGGAPLIISAKVGIELSVGQATGDLIGMGGSALSAVGSYASTLANPLDRLAGSVMTGVGDVLSFLHPQFSNVMVASGTSAYIYLGNLMQEFVMTTQTDNAHLGSPLCQQRVLSSLSGYTQCLDPDVDIPCTDTEHEQILSYLAGGFYIE